MYNIIIGAVSHEHNSMKAAAIDVYQEPLRPVVAGGELYDIHLNTLINGAMAMPPGRRLVTHRA